MITIFRTGINKQSNQCTEDYKKELTGLASSWGSTFIASVTWNENLTD